MKELDDDIPLGSPDRFLRRKAPRNRHNDEFI